jgi:diaminohydroxyphosphoribosylaminopyrimidine deaminase/5-amino-6-(5-phosphoribosylamino)uracil reductase
MPLMDKDSTFMARALSLAKLGQGKVAPNPMVGAVIVHNGKIIGEGYHQEYGGPHAEVNAVDSVKDSGFLRGSTLYVNLEPCNHKGKTPPCTNLIMEKLIPRLIVGQKDPNPFVSGSGIERLMNNGVEVKVGILENECLELNRRFNLFHQKNRPYIILKWAQTEDGFVDLIRKKNDPIQPNWITDDYCRMMVHKWRSEEAGIMVGTEAALKDNPKLNVRSWSGNDPLRIVLDQHLRLPSHLSLFDRSIPTIVYSGKEKASLENLEYVKLNFDDNVLISIMDDLYKRSIQSIIIEGGAKLLNSFIINNLWDEARVFTGPVNFEKGIRAPEFDFNPIELSKTGNSKLRIYRNGER